MPQSHSSQAGTICTKQNCGTFEFSLENRVLQLAPLTGSTSEQLAASAFLLPADFEHLGAVELELVLLPVVLARYPSTTSCHCDHTSRNQAVVTSSNSPCHSPKPISKSVSQTSGVSGLSGCSWYCPPSNLK